MVTTNRSMTAVLLVALALAACGAGSAKGAGRNIPTPVAVSPTPTEAPTPEGRWPLTGVPVDEVPERPVMAVKIENTAAARPLVGVELADLVYEQIVEGGVTRFAALFHSQIPEEVGPVRSARLVDVDLLVPFTPILVYSGARPDVTSALMRTNSLGLVADNGRPVFGRDPNRSRSHDLIAFGPKAYDRLPDLSNVGPVSTVLTFSAEPPTGGDANGEEVDIAMTPVANTGWTYDRDAGMYRRSQNGDPFEVVGDLQIGAANVVVVETTIGTGGCCDTAGNPFTVTDLTGAGDAVVFRNGQRWDVRWEKETVRDHLAILDTDGQQFPLAPGPSWFHLAKADSVTTPDVVPTEPDGSSTDGSET